MISRTWSRKPIAALAAVAVLTVYSMAVLASPGAKASGELSVRGQVTVNGQHVISGGTLFSDSVVVTAEKSNATINISKLGRVDLAPNSSLHLSFSGDSIIGSLDTGSAHVATLAGISVNITTKNGLVVTDGSQATSFTLDTAKGNTMVSTEAGLAELHSGGTVRTIAAGESASVGTPLPQTDDEGLSGGKLAALLLAVGGAVAGIFYAAFHNNDLNFGGSVNVVSPTK